MNLGDRGERQRPARGIAIIDSVRLGSTSHRLACREHGRRGFKMLSMHAKVHHVDRVVRVFRSFEDADEADDEYYAELKPNERLDILLELVERHRSGLGKAASGLERVHRIVELTQR